MLRSFPKPGLFDPEALAAMSEAYEASLKEFDDTGQPEIIAARIVAAANTGERDPLRLREAALPWLACERN